MSARPRPVNLALPEGFRGRIARGELWHLVRKWQDSVRAICGAKTFLGNETLPGTVLRTCGRCAMLHAGEKGDERATTN